MATAVDSHKMYQLVKVSRLYYLERFGQRDIAERLNMSMAKISRLLSEARERGIVEITVHDAQADFREIESRIEDRFGLHECMVVPSRETTAATYRELSRPVSEFLSRFAGRRLRLGVSWGETLKAVADHLEPHVSFADLHVVPIIGGIGTVERGIYPNSVARVFADRAGGVGYIINAPAISATKDVRDLLFRDPRYATVFELWRHLDIAITGVSALDPRDSISLRDGMYTEQELVSLRELGAVASVNSCFFDAHGTELETPYVERVLNVNSVDLKRVPNVVMVAAAPHKVQAVLSALSSGLAGVLVTDEDTARAVIETAQA